MLINKDELKKRIFCANICADTRSSKENNFNKEYNLDLSSLYIDDIDLPFICELLNKCKNIISVNFYFNSICNEGAIILARELKYIKKLNLSGNLITSKGVESFAFNTNIAELIIDVYPVDPFSNKLLENTINLVRKGMKRKEIFFRNCFLKGFDNYCNSQTKNKINYIPTELKQIISEFAFNIKVKDIKIFGKDAYRV